MQKKIVLMSLTIIVLMTAIYNDTCTVYASEHFGSSYEALSTIDKIGVWFSYAVTATGKFLTTDVIGAQDTVNEWISYINGVEYEKKISEMTKSELQDVLDNMTEKMESKGCTCDSNGKVTMSDDFIKEMRSWLDEYIETNDEPLYYMTHSLSFDNLNPSDFDNQNMYYSLRNLVNENERLIFRVYQNYLIVDIIKDFDDVFMICNYTPNKGRQVYFYSKTTEKETLKMDRYTFYFNTAHVVASINDETILTSKYENASLNGYINNFYRYDYMTFLTKDEYYYKAFTSLANYQKYKVDGKTQNVYYTTNYYKTENIQQTSITLDDMVKLYEAYDDLCKKIIQYVKDTQNATDTQIVKKLDELIQAVYSSSSGGSGGSADVDVDVDVDMTETNNILTKIYNKLLEVLEAIKNIHNEPIIDYGDDTTINDWTENVTNIIINPEVNINATVGNMSEAFADSMEMLKKKFPFSIPWDIAFLLEFLADTPDAPKFEIPFSIESMGIHEIVVIDLQNFDGVSKVSRMLLTMLYMVALMQLTAKITAIGKEN